MKADIRKATNNDIIYIQQLLYEVNQIHHDVRPDLFKANATKYTAAQLKEIIANDKTPVFVYEQDGIVLGYAFCIHKQFINDNNLTDVKTLYIDDLCVEKEARGKHIGASLYNYVLDYARKHGYYNVTLNVWADNPDAVKFYEAIGMRVQKLGMEKIL